MRNTLPKTFSAAVDTTWHSSLSVDLVCLYSIAIFICNLAQFRGDRCYKSRVGTRVGRVGGRGSSASELAGSYGRPRLWTRLRREDDRREGAVVRLTMLPQKAVLQSHRSLSFTSTFR